MLPDVVFAITGDTLRREFQFALRSLRFVPHGNVFILADSRPDYLSDKVGFIYHPASPKWQNLHDKFLALAHLDELSPNVYYWEDDYYVVKPVTDEIPNYTINTLAERVGKLKHHNGAWSQSLRDTLKFLQERGFENPISYDVHVPMLVERELLASLEVPENSPPLRGRSLMGNVSARIPTRLQSDVKITEAAELGRVLDLEEGFLSSNELTFTATGVEAYLRTLLPDPCEYEL